MLKTLYFDYLQEQVLKASELNLSDTNLAYDYNEVQEHLFCTEENNFIFLIGSSNLQKNEMLQQTCQELLTMGISKQDILYIDMEFPIYKELDPYKIAKFLQRRETKKQYILINEIQELDNWYSFICDAKEKYPTIKIICTSTCPTLMYEKLEQHSFCKVIVLSEKNPSTIKYKSDGFGVFEEIKYNIKDNYVEIKGLTKKGKAKENIIIPNKINNLPVKIIASGAFHDRIDLKSIHLPDSIKIIGDYAFKNCIKLKEVNLPKSLKSIGECSFLGCTSLENFTGGEDVEYIGNCAFSNTSWLLKQKSNFIMLGKVLYKYQGQEGTICLPLNISTIANFAFASTSINFISLKNIQSLGEGAFYNCKNLSKVNNYVLDYIPSFCFYNCTSLEFLDGIYKKLGKFALYKCTQIKELNVNKLIANSCSLTYTRALSNLNGNISILGTSCLAYSNLSFLPKISKKISKFALYNSNINNIEVGKSISEVEDFAFAECKFLYSIDLRNINKIGKYILYQSTELNSIHIQGNNKLLLLFREYPEKLKELHVYGNIINNFNRSNSHITNLFLYNVNNFGYWSFYENKKLESIAFSNVKQIGAWAFSYCNSIQTITTCKELAEISLNAFRYCYNLNILDLSKSNFITLGNNALYSCPINTVYTNKKNLKKYNIDAQWENYTIKII